MIENDNYVAPNTPLIGRRVGQTVKLKCRSRRHKLLRPFEKKDLRFSWSKDGNVRHIPSSAECKLSRFSPRWLSLGSACPFSRTIYLFLRHLDFDPIQNCWLMRTSTTTTENVETVMGADASVVGDHQCKRSPTSHVFA